MNRPPASLIAATTLVGFLLVVTSTTGSATNRNEEPRKAALVNQILQERSNVDDLDKAVAQIKAQVAGAQSAAGKASQLQAQQNKTQDQLALEAGTIAIKGSGIEVKLADAPTQSGTDSAKFDASRIQDTDIQLIVNALFAAGAEGVSVNDNRVVAVTPIRAAGGTIVVNYRPVDSPYRIDAIGADKSKFEASVVAQHFVEWKKKFKLGYSVDKHKNISLSAYSGRVSIDIAKSAAAAPMPGTPANATSSSTTSTAPSTGKK